MDAINTFGQRQDSWSGDFMDPDQQDNQPYGGKSRREIIEAMLDANSFLLPEAKMKTLKSFLSIPQPNDCIRDPVKDAAYSDKESCGVHGVLPCNLDEKRGSSKFTVDNKNSSSRGDRSNAAETRNERNQYRRETRDVGPRNRQRSPSDRERSSLERNGSSHSRRDARNTSLERRARIDERIDFRPPLDNPYEPDRVERFKDPFKYTNHAKKRGRECLEVYGKTSWNYEEESRNKKARYEEEDRNGSYLSMTKQHETIDPSVLRQESYIHSGKSPLGYDRASNLYGQIPTSGGERSQVSRETRGRSPSTSERSQLHQATRGRSPVGSARNSDRRRRSPFTSERSHSSQETRGRSPSTSERRQRHQATRGRSPVGSARNSKTRRRSPSTSGRSCSSQETRERSQLHRADRGRNPLAIGRNVFHGETRRRSPSTSERSSSRQEKRGRSRERDQFRPESRKLSPLNHERSSLDRNRSSDNGRDVRNRSRERKTIIDERIDFRTPRDNHSESDRIERYEDRLCYPGEDVAASSKRETELRYGRGFSGNCDALMDNGYLNYKREDIIDLCVDEDEPPFHRKLMEDGGWKSAMENKTIVVPERFPDKRFTEFETRIFYTFISSHIASTIPKGIENPQIENGTFVEGALIITTKDEYSKVMLEIVIPKLKGYNGTNFRIAHINELSPIAISTMMAPGQ
ncbi:serine/arginine repetitive matrix protein 2-like [Diabrotica virgifera virgifera]|uniref:Serine/arginine repetitive matrix protein 2-like n=1 Tax=Diabrotica virgifera virgifera TaxID=50390 RepID=A0ABM5IY67_DIAVI|nr:serine/arginine repetitive matrix protein 2-like [Diabrotica virgifera virgifera]XP_028148764.2 serine/arginine repetitive matrix protein 2-like [Diabrotica virgifera virgifera]